MAFCSNCGRAIADSADVCPNCGHPNDARQAAVAQSAAQPGVPALPFAGWWRRFAARLIDTIIIGIPLGLIGDGNQGFGLIGLAYEWLMLGLNNGRTVGKMVMGIRIAHPDQGQISLGTAALRTAMSIVSGFVLLLGYLWAAWDKENRTWHDMVANTRAFHVS